MKKIVSMMFVWAMVVMFSGACTVVEPGYVGIKVNKLGSDRGASAEMVTGFIFYNPFSTSVLTYKTSVQNVSWTKDAREGSPNNEEITFNSLEGLTIAADVAVGYKLRAEKGADFYAKFRTDDITEFTKGFLRNVTRDTFNEVASEYTAEDIYGAKKTEVLNAAKNKVQERLMDIGIVIEQFGYTSSPRLPITVEAALEAKMKATQDAMRAENELRQTKAEAEKVIAAAEGAAEAVRIKSTAEANANREIAKSVTSELIKYMEVNKWNGQLPMVTGSNDMLMTIPSPFKEDMYETVKAEKASTRTPLETMLEGF